MRNHRLRFYRNALLCCTPASALLLALSVPLHGCKGSDDDDDKAEGGTNDSNEAGDDDPYVPPAPDGPPPDTLESCGEFTLGDDLTACTASYLGGSGTDALNAVEIAADGSVLLAGVSPGHDFGGPTEGAGAGVLLVLDAPGGEVLATHRFAAEIEDMALATDTGAVVLGGPALGVIAYHPGDASVLWQDSSPAQRVDIAPDGRVVAMNGNDLRVFGADGQSLGSFQLDDGSPKDVAIYAPTSDDDPLIIVTGFNQVSGNLQQPYLRAYDVSGALQWRNYDWSADDVSGTGLSSDTRGARVAIGRDNRLYYAGESHGGVTTHFKDPRDLSVDAPNVKFDKHNDSYNHNGAAPITYYARFNPVSGVIDRGQILVPRLFSNDKGNGSSPTAISADEHGQVIVGGGSACCIERGDEKTINGLPAMPVYAGGGFVLVVSPDFSERLLWTAWTGDAGGASVNAVAAWGASMAIAATHGPDKDTGEIKGRLVTTQAMQFEPGGGASDGFFSVWPAPPAP